MNPGISCSCRGRGGSTVRLLRYRPAERQPPHAHPLSSITMVLRGAVEERVGSDLEQASSLSVVIKPAGVTHATAFGGDGAVTIQIELSAEDEARAEAGGYRLGWWRWSHAGEATRPMLELARRIRDVDGSEPTLDDLIIETLATLTPSEPCPRGPAPRWLVAARDVLVSESVTIRSLAAQAGVHPIHLAREFRRRFGLAPTGFRRRMRIRRAAALLARSPEPLAAIALEAGFADQSHMNRELRRAAGVTPAGMRRLARV